MHPRSRDEGAALVTVLLVAVVLMGLTATLAVVTQRGTAAARSDVAGASALGQSEAGIAHAIEFLRSPSAVTAINACATGGTCTTPYGTAAGATVSASGRSYTVRIAPVSASTVLSPPTQRRGQYRITSTGSSGQDGRRRVEVLVQVALHRFPFGVYTSENLEQPGGLNGTGISVFSGGCIYKRFQMELGGSTDLYYGGPPAAHAAQYITDSAPDVACSSSDPKRIHRSGACNTYTTTTTTYRHDQDREGGLVAASSGCSPYGEQSPAGSCDFAGAPTSRFTDADLACYNPNLLRGLPDSVYAELKRTAQEQGTYFTSGTYTFTPPTARQGVVYFDVPVGTVVDLKKITSFATTQCAPGGRSVTVVVRRGSAIINDVSLVGSLFIPEGSVQLNGSASIIGTIYARTISSGAGNAQISLHPCYLNDLPSTLLDVRTLGYREVDEIAP